MTRRRFRDVADSARVPDLPDDANRRIAVDHYDTQAVPSHLRHAAWATRGWPSVAALFESRAIGEFSTEADQIKFDDLTLQFASGTARAFDRTAQKARGDGIDILGVGVHFDGEFVGTARDRPFRAAPGALLFLDMTQPSHVDLPAGRSMQLALPRVVAEEHFEQVANLHGLVVSPDRSTMLVGHLLNLREALPALLEHQQPRLARTVIDLLALAIDSSASIVRRNPGMDSDPSGAARREIDARLGLVSLTVPSLCAALRISRSALYRMFEADGGVEAYIRAQRLNRVRDALLDPANQERIGDLAYRWGFSDASHLSRQFRESFGVTPSVFRANPS